MSKNNKYCISISSVLTANVPKGFRTDLNGNNLDEALFDARFRIRELGAELKSGQALAIFIYPKNEDNI